MKNSQLKRFKFVCSIRWNIIRLLKIATIWKTAHQSTVFTRSLNFSNFIRRRIVKLLTICISNEVKSLFFITSLFSATFEQFLPSRSPELWRRWPRPASPESCPWTWSPRQPKSRPAPLFPRQEGDGSPPGRTERVKTEQKHHKHVEKPTDDKIL